MIPAKVFGVVNNRSTEMSCILLRLDLEYVNCKSVFMGGGIEPGLGGLYGSINRIRIFDSRNDDITDKFIGIAFKGNLIRDTSEINGESFFYNSNLQELKDNINLHKRDECGTGLTFPRAFIDPSNIKLPLYFKIYFNNSDSLVQKITYDYNDIRTFRIEN